MSPRLKGSRRFYQRRRWHYPQLGNNDERRPTSLQRQTVDLRRLVEQRRLRPCARRRSQPAGRARVHTAFALPLLGLVLGFVIATRPARETSRHGRWIIGLSIVASVIWVLVFTSGVLTSTSNDM